MHKLSIVGGADVIRRATPARRETAARFVPPPSAAVRGSGKASVIEQIVVIVTLLLINSLNHFGNHIGIEGDEQMGGSPIAQVVWGLSYACVIFGIFLSWRRAGFLLRRSVPILIIIAIIFLSTFWSTDPSLTLKRAIGLIGTTAIAYYLACRFELPKFLDILMIATGLAAIFSVIAVIALPTGKLTGEQYGGSWQGIYGGKNFLGQAMALGIITLFAAPIGKNKWKRAFLFGTGMLCAGLLVGSRSLTSLLLCIVVSFVTVLALVWRSKPWLRPVLVIAGALGAGALLVAAATGFGGDSVLAALGRDSTLTGRTDVWPYVQQAIGDRPFFGFGYCAFWAEGGAVLYYLPPDAGWTPAHAHNGFLELCLDIGILGACFFAIPLVVGLWRSVAHFVRNADRWTIWPLAAILFFVLANIDESSIAKYNNLNWVVFVAAYLYTIPRSRSVNCLSSEHSLRGLP